MVRPWCCPEPRCTPVYALGEVALVENAGVPMPGESFICFGKMPERIEFVYDGCDHANDLRSCHYTPLKGVVANQENADDWRAIVNAYSRALDHLGDGWASQGPTGARNDPR